ncbi:MAG: Zn-dependent alcohol dehydrogenase [Actinomycetota bacterium]
MSTQATAAVLRTAGAPLELTEITVDPPRQGEVAVEIVAAGLCHSDLTVTAGKIPAPTPAVPGHEAAGVVTEVGPGVRSVEPGDHVILSYRPNCGGCTQCVRGRPVLCEVAARLRRTGLLPDGTSRLHRGDEQLFHFSGVSAFTEHTVVPESGVVRVDSSMPLDVLSVVGCAVMTGYGAVVNAAQVRPGQSALVIGCGGVGINAVQACRISGANPIIAVDRSPAARSLAQELGATNVVDPDADDLAAVVAELTDGGVEVAIEAVGVGALIESSVDLVCPGGAVIVVGVPPAASRASFSPAQLLSEEKRLVGTLYGSSVPKFDVPRILDHWRSGELAIDRIVTSRYALADINEGLAALEAGLEGRAIVEIRTSAG